MEGQDWLVRNGDDLSMGIWYEIWGLGFGIWNFWLNFSKKKQTFTVQLKIEGQDWW